MLPRDGAHVVKVGAHHDDGGVGRAVGELAHGDDAVVVGVPAPGGAVGRLAEPAGLVPGQAPGARAVEDGGELAVRLALFATAADVTPARAQASLDVVDLGVEGLLEADEGAVVALCDEFQLGDELGAADLPRLLICDGVLGRISDVVGDEA